MRIESIQLNNIRSHIENTINLEPGITVLTGKTGSGKSTFLMAVEFALFGSGTAVSNTALLRRGEKEGYVTVTFREGDDTYTVIRGLKRTKQGVRTNNDKSKLIKNGEKVILAGRDSDITGYLCNILGYKMGNPRNLFEVTSYCKQDEIRQIINMSEAKRQEYIDKILRLAKYFNTWKNMKYGIDYLNNKLEAHKTVSVAIENLESEILKLELKKEGIKKKVDSNKEKRASFSKTHEKFSLDAQNCEKLLDDLKDKRDSFLNLKATLDKINVEIDQRTKSKEIIEKKISSLTEERDKLFKGEKIENVGKSLGKVVGEIESIQSRHNELQEEIESIKNLETGKCPKCKQDITKEHIHVLEDEYKKDFDVIDRKLVILKKEQNRLKELESKAEQMEQIEKEFEKSKTILSEVKTRLSEITNEQSKLDDELKKYVDLEEVYGKSNERLKFLNQEILQISNKLSSLNSEITLYEKELQENRENQSRYKERLNELNKSKKEIIKIEQTNKLLINLREDIRKIRESIRSKFLEDFRDEFQKKFEEIRTEEEYIVDIKPSYEPIASSSNKEEVSIDHLSGGEKTSVALAYRLALANIAAQIASLSPSEILILDEPTIGLDKDDIQVLPDLLRGIQTIPQIVIVSHEENLKQAADYRYTVVKEKGASKIISS